MKVEINITTVCSKCTGGACEGCVTVCNKCTGGACVGCATLTAFIN
jgi:hypothetical protein